METQMSTSTSTSYHSYHRHHNKKRKLNCMSMGTDAEDESETCSSMRTVSDDSKKQNHSEIEKRRRDKMNTFITELSGMVPMCSAMSRKLDKLTVLRMAVQHMKTLRGSRIHSYTEGHYKPSFVTDQELKNLILQSAEGFLFVVGCDRGRILYVSESVFQVLKFSQTDLLGQSWFDILHPKDIQKVKEQLSSPDLSPRERLIDAKTMLPVKGNVPQKANRLCPGARRSFFCRMKCKSEPQVKEELDIGNCNRKKKSSNSDRKYSVVHCTGYLKSWAKIGMEENEGDSEDACNLSCLVAVGRILPRITQQSITNKHRPISFISRHTVDGKFIFVDQRCQLILGFLPQELLGTSMYEYYHSDDISSLADSHKAALSSNETISTQIYRFRTRESAYVKLYASWKAFRNPWTKETEYLVAKNTLVFDDEPDRANCLSTQDFDLFSHGTNGRGNRDIRRLISNQMEASKIGKLIADEITDPGRRLTGDSPSNSNSPEDVEGLRNTNTTKQEVEESLLSPHTFSSLNSEVNNKDILCINNDECEKIDSTNDTKKLLSSLDNQQQQQQQLSSSSSSSASNTTVIQQQQQQQQQVNEERQSFLGVNSTVATVTTTSSIATGTPSRNSDDDMSSYMIGGGLLNETSHQTSDGNDEAAMAVIMSLLEADAGLGGPVDFSGLPWPLP